VIYFAYPVYFFTLPYVIISVVHFITVPVIYYFFVYQTLDKKCTRIQMDGKTFDMFIWKNVLINVVLLIVCIRIAVEYNDMKMREVIIWLQLFWTFPAAVNFAEFARVWLFGVRLINVDGERNEVTKQSVESKKSIPEPEPQSKLLASKPTCNICSAAYTETGIRTPRIIKECGHTICEQCASKLLNVKCQNLLECPFCQKPTIVNGPAETLPKNFALLEQIESVQKIPMLSVKPNPIAFTYPVRFITLPSAVAIPVYIIVVPAIYHFFVGQTLGYKCTWIKIDEKTFEKFLWTNLLIHVVLLIPCIRIAIGYDNEETRAGIIILQFFLTIPFAATLADFALVLLFGIRLIDVNEERKEVTKQSVESKKTIPEPEPQSKSVPSKPSCNICSAPYTETGCHTPRMLRECGHTICEQCANKLLNAKLQNLLVCPFCEKVTVVNGPAETLPKNFALLEQIKSVGKMPMMSVKPNVF
ncbi:unnamed protein product, partial [Caenorhabditis brenneri]